MRSAIARAILLSEARDPALIANRYRQKLEQRAREDRTLTRLEQCDPNVPVPQPEAEDFAVQFVRYVRACADPTQDGRYTEWIVKTWANGGIRYAEDLERTRIALDKLVRFGRQLEEPQRDVNRYRTLGELERTVLDLGPVNPAKQRRKELERQMAVRSDPETWNWRFRSADYGVVTPRNHAESCAIAAWPRTTWCTAVRDSARQYEHYVSSGPLYIVIVPGNIRSRDDIRRMWQVHFDGEELSIMDEEDEPVDDPIEFLMEYDAVTDLMVKDGVIPKAYEKVAVLYLAHHVEEDLELDDYLDLLVIAARHGDDSLASELVEKLDRSDRTGDWFRFLVSRLRTKYGNDPATFLTVLEYLQDLISEVRPGAEHGIFEYGAMTAGDYIMYSNPDRIRAAIEHFGGTLEPISGYLFLLKREAPDMLGYFYDKLVLAFGEDKAREMFEEIGLQAPTDAKS